MALPLEGVRVIDMSHVIAGPMASLYLAQLGAEVIKIEPPQGEVMRASRTPGDADAEVPAGFAALNAGKRSLALDARLPEHAELIRRLARTADVFIENFRPGVVSRLGLDEPAIRAVRPDIVYCSISGFGQHGEWSRRGAYDHVVQALTGMMMMSGESDDAPPVKVGFPVVDVAVGMLAALSITAALHRRMRDGVGDTIDASMTQAAVALMYPHACGYLTHGTRPRRVGNKGYTGSPTADTYRCTDGWLAVAANTPVQFRKLAGILGLEALCEDAEALDLQAFNAAGGGFVVARDLPRVQQCFRDAFVSRSAGVMEARLNAAGIPAARVRRLDEFLDEAHAAGQGASRRDYAQPGAHPAQVRTPGLGFDCAGLSRPTSGAPALGQDTAALLAELGVAPERVQAWCRAGSATEADAAPKRRR